MATKYPPLEYTPIDEIDNIHARLRKGFESRKTRPIEWRKQQVAQLGYMLQDNAERFEAAWLHDMGRHPNDSHLCELGSTHGAIVHTLKNMEKWAKTKKAPFHPDWFIFRPKVRQEPRGVVMIIGPFNYPIFTSIPPMAVAIAAGNAVLFKPSEQLTALSALLAELFPKYLDPEVFACVNGSIPETTRLLELRWDHIFFTGSPKVARVIARAAAEHLTPLTLELGGKGPAILDPSPKGRNLDVAARRILWGKTVNAGQTCMCPDYALVLRDQQDDFIAALLECYERFWPKADGGPKASVSLSRIISESQCDRLKGLLDRTSGKIVIGGEVDREAKYVAPTIVRDCTGEDALMSEEIFGPILPIVPVDSIEEALAFANAREHPLSIMIFSKQDRFKEYILDHTQSGSALGNECLFNAGCVVLPFGGVGNSGYGKHVGKYGFETFSHQRSYMDSPPWIDNKFLFGVRFAPFKKSDLATIKWIWGEPRLPHPRLGEKPSWSVLTWLTSGALVGLAVAILYSSLMSS